VLFWAALASAESAQARATESTPASAEATRVQEQEQEPPRRRYEFLPVPNLGGNSDVGVELGVAFTLARFHDEQRPYRWLLGGVFSASFKDDAAGLRAIQQFHLLRFDLPNLLSGRLRLDNRLSFSRNVVAHYYGLGNESVPGPRTPSSDSARQNQYISQELRLRSLARVKTGTLFDAAFALNLRYDMPTPFASSRLVTDVAQDGVLGSKHALLSTLAAGVILDTRDNEFVPRHGVYYQLGASGTLGSAERVAYGEVGTNLASYISLARPVIFATRVITSFQFGRVPFFDAQQTNVLSPQYMLGSAIGVRGIPLGRYAGHIKVLAEARAACDRLVVGINSDASVRRLKGEGRPVQTEHARAEVLAALEAVDLVVVFEEDTPFELIKQVRPQVLVKGGDYSRKEVVGYDIVEADGGEVLLIDLVPGQSTSGMVARSGGRPKTGT